MSFSAKIENPSKTKMNYSEYNIEFSHIYPGDIKDGKLSAEQRESVSVAKEITERIRQQGKSFSLCVLIDDYNGPNDLEAEIAYDLLAEQGLPPDHICFEAKFAGDLADTLIDSLDKGYIHKGENDDILFDFQTVDLRLWVPVPTKKSFREMLIELPEEPAEKAKKRSFRQLLVEDGLPNIQTNPRNLPARPSLSADTETYLRESYQSRTEIVLRRKLDSGYQQYSCPLLASCWYLARLGVEPFSEVEKTVVSFTGKPFFGKKLITILPISYLKIEATVYEILAASKRKAIRRKRNNFSYHFY